MTTIDLIIILIFLAGTAALGIKAGQQQRSLQDYFLGGRNLPWFAVALSILATETSTLTFISIPGLAYSGNFNFLQISFGYLLGRVLISVILLPAYFKSNLSTVYEFLGRRFGSKIQMFTASVFLITRLLADSVRLFATAIPLSLLTGWNYATCIILITGVTLIYTYLGGIRAVVWMDVIQFVIYLGGAALVLLLLCYQQPQGWHGVIQKGATLGKLQIINTGFDLNLKQFFATNYTLLSGLVGGALLSMASHGTDQIIVQRLLTCKNLLSAQKALISSGVMVIAQFTLFLLLGLLLFVHFDGRPMRPDEVFPRYLVAEMPTGLVGFFIASLFAAAMSTLSSSFNSLASSTLFDFIKKYRPQLSSRHELQLSRGITLGWGMLMAGIASLFSGIQNPVVELGLSIASFTYGGMLGVFILGNLDKRATEESAFLAKWLTILFMIWIIRQSTLISSIMLTLAIVPGIYMLRTSQTRLFNKVVLIGIVLALPLVFLVKAPQFAWPWFVPLGCSFCLMVGYFLSRINR